MLLSGRKRLLCLLVLLLSVFLSSVPPQTDATQLIISDYPHYQTFDSWPDCWESSTCYEQQCNNLLGGWTNLQFDFARTSGTGLDEFHWWVKSGPTPSNTMIGTGQTFSCANVVTGPCGDATSGTGKYMYAEASGCYGARFRVASPVFYFTNSSATLSYEYYMYGRCIVPTSIGLLGSYLNPAMLIVSMSLDNGTTFPFVLANHTTENPKTSGAAWVQNTVPLSLPYLPIYVQFQFMVLAAGGFGGYNASRIFEADVAIDNVLVTQLGASNITVPFLGPFPNNTNPSGGTSSSSGSGLVSGGDGLSDGSIAGIVVGIVAGLSALCCLLLLLGILLLLLLSPRKKGQKRKKAEEEENPAVDAGNDGL